MSILVGIASMPGSGCTPTSTPFLTTALNGPQWLALGITTVSAPNTSLAPNQLRLPAATLVATDAFRNSLLETAMTASPVKIGFAMKPSTEQSLATGDEQFGTVS